MSNADRIRLESDPKYRRNRSIMIIIVGVIIAIICL
jgi:hypothetical protein